MEEHSFKGRILREVERRVGEKLSAIPEGSGKDRFYIWLVLTEKDWKTEESAVAAWCAERHYELRTESGHCSDCDKKNRKIDVIIIGKYNTNTEKDD